jgi:hypothetical protein
MMISNHQRPHLPPGTEAACASNILDSGPQVRSASGQNAPGGRGARWASLDSNDRAVFNIWARRVTAFYSLLIISLVAAMLLGAHISADRKLLAASPAMELSSPEMPAPITGSVGK